MAAEDLGKKAGDLANQAGEFMKQNADKIDEALKSQQAEDISDKLLGGAADLANKVTGGKYADQVEDVRKNLDGKIGTD